MRLEQLTYLVEIAKTNSMSLAAENLHIAQSSLSLSIKQLEEELDTIIFTRSKKGTFLTEQGDEIYHKAYQILNMVQSLYPDTTPSNQNYQKNINISSVSIFRHVIQKIIVTLYNKNDKLKPTITIANAENINHNLAKNTKNYDFIFTTMSSEEMQYHMHQLHLRFHVYLIGESNISLMASLKAPYANSSSISIARLKKLPLIQYSSDGITDEFLCSVIEKKFNLTLNKTLKVNDSNSVADYIENGLGVSLVTPFTKHGFHSTLASSNTIMIPLKEKVMVSFVLLLPKDKPLTNTQQLFFNTFSKYYPQMKELK